MKLITKLGNQIVAKEKISSANDIIGNRSRQLKVFALINKNIFHLPFFVCSLVNNWPKDRHRTIDIDWRTTIISTRKNHSFTFD